MANQKTETKKPNVVLYVLIAVVVIVAGYFIYTMMNDEKPIEHKVSTEKVDKQKEPTGPQFKKQGEIEFVSAKDASVIKKIDVEVADNDAKRSAGLCTASQWMNHRECICVRCFRIAVILDEEHNTSLDIMFVNENKEIVKIHQNTTPFSETSLPSEKKSMYVVEVNGGFSDKYGVKEGDKIDFKITNY